MRFRTGFIWGTATSAHQVEGGNSNSDWWEWELKPDTPCREPSGAAIDHYNRYGRDVAMLAGLGFNTYRFSVEWPRIEPSEGSFDEAQLEHYRRVVEAVRKSNLTPMVTLYHFTLPIWVAKKGGWLADETPALFERYVRRVVEALGDGVDWYCTINEPGVVAYGGYVRRPRLPARNPRPDQLEARGAGPGRRAQTGPGGREGTAPERARRPDPFDAGVGDATPAVDRPWSTPVA